MISWLLPLQSPIWTTMWRWMFCSPSWYRCNWLNEAKVQKFPFRIAAGSLLLQDSEVCEGRDAHRNREVMAGQGELVNSARCALKAHLAKEEQVPLWTIMASVVTSACALESCGRLLSLTWKGRPWRQSHRINWAAGTPRGHLVQATTQIRANFELTLDSLPSGPVQGSLDHL